MRSTNNRTVSVLKALSLALLVILVFSVVWLRSSVTTIEYKLSDLEKKKTEALREQKTLVAQKAGLMALTRVETSDLAGYGFSFPERKKVVYVKGTGYEAPSRVSYNAQ
jgi:hypothetical protein